MFGWYRRLGIGTKLTVVLGISIAVMSAFNIFWSVKKQSELSEIQAKSFATGVSDTVLGSLNSMMLNGIMDERKFFLDLLKKTTTGIDELRIIRSESVNIQFENRGYGREEEAWDSVERGVLSSGESVFRVEEDASGKKRFRAVVPFIMSSDRGGMINCMDCHDGQEGTVNGAITMVLSMDEIEKKAASDLRQQVIMFVVELILIIAVLVYVVRKNLNNVLFGVIEVLTENSEQVAAASTHIADASLQLSEASTQQAASIEETSSTLMEFSSAAQKNAKDANEANNRAEVVSGLTRETSEQMGKAVKAMEEVSKSSAEISRVIKLIEEIAFQTNLLALNAAVEAARAGEHGKGFAVVAEEVRSLAQRASAASKDTEELIRAADANSKKGVNLVNEAAGSLADITKAIEDVDTKLSSIAIQSDTQAEGVLQINSAVEQIDASVQRNAATSEETAAASGELKQQTGNLNDAVRQLVAMAFGNKNEKGPQRLLGKGDKRGAR
jgi:methyl-accepting chemotaxis protein